MKICQPRWACQNFRYSNPPSRGTTHCSNSSRLSPRVGFVTLVSSSDPGEEGGSLSLDICISSNDLGEGGRVEFISDSSSSNDLGERGRGARFPPQPTRKRVRHPSPPAWAASPVGRPDLARGSLPSTALTRHPLAAGLGRRSCREPGPLRRVPPDRAAQARHAWAPSPVGRPDLARGCLPDRALARHPLAARLGRQSCRVWLG